MLTYSANGTRTTALATTPSFFISVSLFRTFFISTIARKLPIADMKFAVKSYQFDSTGSKGRPSGSFRKFSSHSCNKECHLNNGNNSTERVTGFVLCNWLQASWHPWPCCIHTANIRQSFLHSAQHVHSNWPSFVCLQHPFSEPVRRQGGIELVLESVVSTAL